MKPSILLCSHDAGGANLLLAWALTHPENSYGTLLSGPAINIYKKSNLNYNQHENIESLPQNIDKFICSTGWQADWEKTVIEFCIGNNKDVTVYLDHWVNYLERFTRNNTQYLPDEIWVGDAYAEKIAKKHFPESTIKLVENPYFLISAEAQHLSSLIVVI